MKALLKVAGGRWGYRNGGKLFCPARSITFEVRRAEIVLLKGENGTGKTTILRGLLGLVEKAEGEVAFATDRSEIGYVPQESSIERSVPASVLDLVRSGSPDNWNTGVGPAEHALDYVGIAGLKNRRYAMLSGGQRQRVLVARALVGNPKLLFLDEPTINVDAETAAGIGALLSRLCGEVGMGIVITTHATGWVRATREVRVFAGED